MKLKEIFQQKAEGKRVKEEEERLAELKQLIANFDEKIEKIQARLSNLKEAHNQAGASLEEVKVEKQELSKATAEIESIFSDKDFHSILEEEGINTLEDLVSSDKYSDQEDVRSLKERKQSYSEKKQVSREKIKDRRKTKIEAHESVISEKPNSPLSLNYKDITAGLENIVKELTEKRNELHYQTPEGKEEFKQEIFNKISERHFRRNQNGGFMERFRIDHHFSLVAEKDIKDAEKYGEENVKLGLRNYYEKAVDDEFAKEDEKNGLTKQQEIIKTIEKARESWDEIGRNLNKLEGERKETINQLVSLLIDNPELYKAIQEYGARGRREDEVAEKFIDHLDELNGISLSSGTFQALERTVSSNKSLLQKIVGKDGLQDAYKNDLHYISGESAVNSELENPERTAQIVNEQLKIYGEMKKSFSAPEELAAAMQDHGVHSNFSALKKIAGEYSSGSSSPDRYLKFEGKAFKEVLSWRDFSKAKEHSNDEQKKSKDKAEMLKKQIVDKLEADWSSEKLSKFERGHFKDPLFVEAKEIARKQEIVKKLSPQLDLAEQGLKGQMDEQVSFMNGEVLEFCDMCREDFNDLRKEIYQLEKDIKSWEEDIDNIDYRGEREGDGLIGGKKRKRETEKGELKKQINGANLKLKDLKEKCDPFDKKYKYLDKIHPFLSDLRQKEIEIAKFTGPFSLGDFFESVRSQIDFKITPEQAKVLAQYLALEGNKEKIASQYNERWKNNRY